MTTNALYYYYYYHRAPPSSWSRSRRPRGSRGRRRRGGSSVLFGRLFGRRELAPGRRLVDVRVVKESREQHQVTEVHGRRQGDVEFGHAARLRAAGLQVTVRGVVDETTDQHLRQLTGRDGHRDGRRRPVAHRAHRVIRVHHRVHRVVHHDEPPRGRRELVVREPRVQQHGDVMVPVQEDQWLFAQHDEYGVAQLR